MGNIHSHKLPTPTEAERLCAQRETKLKLQREKKVAKRADRELTNIRKAMKAGESQIRVRFDNQNFVEFRQACERLIPVLAARGFSAELISPRMGGLVFQWKTMEPLPKYVECTSVDAHATRFE